jgi:hypothetical protein
MKFITQSLILILSFSLIFAWEHTPLSSYTIPSLGFLIFLYLLVQARRKNSRFLAINEGPWSIFILNTVIFLLIFSTGGIYSVLFFLLYFLGFGISFVFEPSVIFVFIALSILIFVPDAIKNDVFGNFIRVGSLLIILPLAFFFGREYRKTEKQDENLDALKERSKDSADIISDDVGEILKNEKDSLKEEDVKKLNEILEETEDLRQEKKE